MKNTYHLLVQVRNFLLPLSLKVFRHKEIDTIFLSWLFHLPQTTCCTYHKSSVSFKSQLSSLEAKTQLHVWRQELNSLTFSQISAHASGLWRHSHSPVTIPIWDFYFDICEWHILPARAWTPALMLHLTNPCAKWKVLSLTKPKGMIYKTKSLGHYITESVYIFLYTLSLLQLFHQTSIAILTTFKNF